MLQVETKVNGGVREGMVQPYPKMILHLMKLAICWA